MPNNSTEAYNRLQQMYNQLIEDIQKSVDKLQELSYNNHIYINLPDNNGVDAYTLALALFYDKLPHSLDDGSNISPISQFPMRRELNEFIYYYRNIFSIDIDGHKKDFWQVLLEINTNKILNLAIMCAFQPSTKAPMCPTILKVKNKNCGIFTINWPSNNIVTKNKHPYEEMLDISNRIKSLKNFLISGCSEIDKLDLRLCQLIAENKI